MRFATKTTVQRRITRAKVFRSRLARRGMIAVSVFSVKSCWRAMMTIEKTHRIPEADDKGTPGPVGQVGTKESHGD